MKTISIDLETYSDVDLQKCGVYKYAQSEKIPKEIIKALTDENIIKWSFNASFERVCLSEYLRKTTRRTSYLTAFVKTQSGIILIRHHGDAL